MNRTTITLLLALASCNNDTDATDESTSPATSLGSTLDPETNSGDLDSSSSESGSTDPDSSSEEASTTDGDGSDSTGEPECPDPGAAGLHEACGPSCAYGCDAGLTCRTSYAGGYLAECTVECTTNDECSSGACSGGWCIVPCGPAGECAAGTYCYPGTSADTGEPVLDPNHPDRHCMPHVL